MKQRIFSPLFFAAPGRLRFAAMGIILIAALAGCGNGMFYYPDHAERFTPERAGQQYEDVYFTSRDGTRLHGWFIHARGRAKGTIVHFHGNAQNITAHYPLIYWLPEEGYNLFTFDYRGYGQSAGAPSREGIHDDALAAIDYVSGRPDTASAKLILLGQSLGGTLAIVAGAERKDKIRALIIESTFSSYQDIAEDKAHAIPVAGSIAGMFPAALLATSEYDAIDYVGKLAPVPILFMHGTADGVIPLAHTQRLYARAGEPKEFWTLQGGGHIEAFSRFLPQLRPRIVEFIEHAPAAGSAEEEDVTLRVGQQPGTVVR